MCSSLNFSWPCTENFLPIAIALLQSSKNIILISISRWFTRRLVLSYLTATLPENGHKLNTGSTCPRVNRGPRDFKINEKSWNILLEQKASACLRDDSCKVEEPQARLFPVAFIGLAFSDGLGNRTTRFCLEPLVIGPCEITVWVLRCDEDNQDGQGGSLTSRGVALALGLKANGSFLYQTGLNCNLSHTRWVGYAAPTKHDQLLELKFLSRLQNQCLDKR